MPGSSNPDSGLTQLFEEMIHDVAVLCTSAETLEVFPQDHELRDQLQPGAELARQKILALLDTVDGWIRARDAVAKRERTRLLGRFREQLQPFVCGPGDAPPRSHSLPCYRLYSGSPADLVMLPAEAFVEALVADFRLSVMEVDWTSPPDTERLHGNVSALLYGAIMADT